MGYPDYWTRTKTDIVAQSVGEIAVDIAVQTLTALGVDITAQSVGNLAIDLAAQSLGNLGIDIAAQSIGDIDVNFNSQAANVDVNLDSQSSDVNVNLNAQTADIDVNLNAQTADIDINVAGQTLSEIINRPTYGGCDSDSFIVNVGIGDTESLFSVSGTGKVYGGYILAGNAQQHKDDKIYFIIDGTTVCYETLEGYFLYELKNNEIFTFYVTNYQEKAGDYKYYFGISRDITFETSLAISYFNNSANLIQTTGRVLYATV